MIAASPALLARQENAAAMPLIRRVAMLSLGARARLGSSREELLSDAEEATSMVLATRIAP
jgi:hypothetical protein